MAGVLYVVATPIGNLGDLTRRAEEVLKSVQIVAAEDTRRTGVLLAHIGHRAPELVSLHEHNEAEASAALIERLVGGADVAVVSDAGTPLVNDPGYDLVRLAWARDIAVVPVPGPSAITAALSVCPLPCQQWTYLGFLPAKAQARRRCLAEWLPRREALVFFEAPHRIQATLRDIAELTDKRVLLARELTKQHETLYVGTASELVDALPEQPKGELVGIVEARAVATTDHERERVLRVLLEDLAPAQAARLAARICGGRKSELYELALRLAE